VGFLNNYEKPGPGVRKDAPKQKAVPRFFSIFQRKFFDLCKLNLLFCIPFAAAVAIFFGLNYLIPYPIIDLIPVIFLFPFIGGLTYVTRNYAREEHAFIYSDFKDAVKNNWVPLLLDGALCYVFGVLMSIAMPFYWSASSGNALMAVALGICIVVTLLFLFSQYYVPLMIVTFDLKLRQILKNAFIFVFLGFGRNFLITFLLAIIGFLLWIALYDVSIITIIMFFFLIFLMFAYCSYLICFAAYPLVDKFMVQPYLKEQKKNHPEKDGEGDYPDFSDNVM
jgi:uncharacterized membrane protein YesL